MFRENNSSTSTKRRRLRNEIDFIHNLSLNVSSTSEIVLDPPISNVSVPYELNNIEYIRSYDTVTSICSNDHNLCPISDEPIVNNEEHDFESFPLDKNNYNSDSSDENDVFSKEEPPAITYALIKWAIEHNVPNNSFDNLLKILKTHKCFSEFPVTCRTLYKTHSEVSYEKPVEVKTVSPGIYYHFGVAYNIKKHLDKDFADETIRLVIGVDGLPLSKSSGSCFWPILGYIRQNKNQSVFPIGIYWGNRKPDDSNVFMKDFVEEITYLIQNGIDVEHLNNKTLTVVEHKNLAIDSFCCDTPAKSFLLSTKSHTGFFSCTRCTVKGKYLHKRVCFPDLECSKRNHNNFVHQIHRQYHTADGKISEILNIPGLDVVKQFSIDYMHAVCLGAMKKLLMLWKGDKIARVYLNNQKFNSRVIKHISERLLTLKKQIPSDFVRKPRSLDELARWKATEFRLFLLYVGPIAIYSIVPNAVYQHFLSLNIAMTIYLSPNYSHLAHYAKLFIHDFVKKFGSIYGEHFISHNMHALIHLHEDYENYGSLDNVSCFKFENYMSILKKMVRKNDKPLQQVVKRCEERNASLSFTTSLSKPNNIFITYENVHFDGPLTDETSSPQYKVLILEKMKIKINSDADSYVGLKINGVLNIIKVVNICYSKILKTQIVLGRKFQKLENFFDKPIKSEQIGVYKVSDFSKQMYVWKIENIMMKYLILSTEDLNFKVAYPIIHFTN